MNDAFYAIMHGRRSIRRYQDRAVPQDMLERLLTAATYAPSAHNRQPWRFMVITDSAVKHKLAAAMGGRLRSDLLADQVAADVIDRDVNRSYSRISLAPALIVVCLSMADMDRYPDEPRASHEYSMAVQSTAMAVQNLLLAAHAEGLGACWMCAPLFCPDVVSETLGLPADWQPQALITMGYPAEARQSTRHGVETRSIWR